MNHTKLLISAALAGIMSASAAQADEAAAASVKCYGISKAGANDCSNSTGSHGCKGEAKTDNDPTEWVQKPAAECEKAGGKTSGPDAPK